MEWPRKSAKPLSIRLRDMWQDAEQAGVPSDECADHQQRELGEYAAIWQTGSLQQLRNEGGGVSEGQLTSNMARLVCNVMGLRTE